MQVSVQNLWGLSQFHSDKNDDPLRFSEHREQQKHENQVKVWYHALSLDDAKVQFREGIMIDMV